GHAVRWVSRVGADGFGDHLVETVGSYGVDVSGVRRDASRPTGVYFRTAGERGTAAHEVAYYRAGSAASAMTVGNVEVGAGRVLHLSGITAALSDGCLELMRSLTAPREGRPVVSFDVNHRSGLWRDADGAEVLRELARGADVVFVGEDEAEEVWGVTGGPSAVREVLPEPAVLVVKQGGRGATAFVSGAGERGLVAQFPAPLGPLDCGQSCRWGGTGGRSGTPPTRASETPPTATPTFEPAPTVDVVSTTGAGDAFAAGFLSGLLRGLPVGTSLRTGHLWAAAALTVPGDLATPPSRAHADQLVALDEPAWERLRLGPGWTQAAQAPEEVRTP
ncbi:MAG: sugar kinase, partial [Streptomyces sp.]|nr:sugar kinase [Streptomyces sp.]